jgi:transposase
MAASTLHRSKTALGAYLRRLKTRLGSPKAITAVAHKLAVTIYNMLKTGAEYVELGAGYYEERYRERLIKNLTRKARQLGYEIVHKPELSQA